MSDLLTSLPGDIPGLLLRGAPVPHPRRRNVPCVIVNITPATAKVAYPWVIDGMAGDDWALRDLALDLSGEDGKTGRAHAVWWLGERPISLLRAAADIGPHALGEIMDAARRGVPMTPERIDILARLVLRLAGR